MGLGDFHWNPLVHGKDDEDSMVLKEYVLPGIFLCYTGTAIGNLSISRVPVPCFYSSTSCSVVE